MNYILNFVDFSTVITALGVVFGALAVVFIVSKGGKFLLSAIFGSSSGRNIFSFSFIAAILSNCKF